MEEKNVLKIYRFISKSKLCNYWLEWSSQCKMNQLNYISSRLKPIWSRKSGWVLTLIWLKCVTNNCVAPYHQLSIEHCNIVKLAENILCTFDSRIRGNNDVDQLNWFSEPNAPGQENWDNALSCHVESWHQLADKNVARAANRVRRGVT